MPTLIFLNKENIKSLIMIGFILKIMKNLMAVKIILLFLLKNKAFLNIVNSNLIKKISIKLLNSESTILCPRMIVRSFSNLSERCTYAHRDKEYFKSFKPKNVITCWIPLGLVGSNNGQLIYLLDSHKKKKR